MTVFQAPECANQHSVHWTQAQGNQNGYDGKGIRHNILGDYRCGYCKPASSHTVRGKSEEFQQPTGRGGGITSPELTSIFLVPARAGCPERGRKTFVVV